MVEPGSVIPALGGSQTIGPRAIQAASRLPRRPPELAEPDGAGRVAVRPRSVPEVAIASVAGLDLELAHLDLVLVGSLPTRGFGFRDGHAADSPGSPEADGAVALAG